MSWLATSPRADRSATVYPAVPRHWTAATGFPSLSALITAEDGFDLVATLRTDRAVAMAEWRPRGLRDHVLFRPAAAGDLTGRTLAFSLGLTGDAKPLDDAAGAALEVETAGGDVYRVRLWHYRTDADDTDTLEQHFTLPLDRLHAGFSAIDETDAVDLAYRLVPVTDVRALRLAIPGDDTAYGTGTATPLVAPNELVAEIRDLSLDGAAVATDDRALDASGLGVADHLDELMRFPAEHVVDRLELLGLDGEVIVAFGNGRCGGVVDDGGTWEPDWTEPLAPPATAWLADFSARCDAAGLALSVLVAFEAFDGSTPAAADLADVADAMLAAADDHPPCLVIAAAADGDPVGDVVSGLATADVEVTIAAPAELVVAAGEWDWPASDRVAVAAWAEAGYPATGAALAHARADGYAMADIDLIAGGVSDPAALPDWSRADAALDLARGRGRRFVWSFAALCRDGFVPAPRTAPTLSMPCGPVSKRLVGAVTGPYGLPEAP